MIIHHSHTRGFTLVEMLVAVSVFAVISLGATALISSVLTSKEELTEESERMRALQTTHALLKADLIQAVVRQTRAADGSVAPFAFQAGGLSPLDPVLDVTRLGWTNPAGLEDRGTVERVRYDLNENVLVRTAPVRPDAGPDTPTRTRDLLEGVERIDVRLLRAGQWVSQLAVAPGGRERLPQAVEITFVLKDLGEVRWLFQTPGARQ